MAAWLTVVDVSHLIRSLYKHTTEKHTKTHQKDIYKPPNKDTTDAVLKSRI